MDNQYVKLVIDDTTFILDCRFLSGCEYWNTARDCNASYKLHIILKGACELDVASETHNFEKRQAILIAPNESTSLSIRTSTMVERKDLITK